MKGFRRIIFIFSGCMLVLLIMLAWGALRFYTYEQSMLVQKTEGIVKKAADSIQRANLTINNMLALDNDSERSEKNAFAVGMTGNQGKMRIYWGDGDTTHYPKAPDTVIRIDRKFLIANHAIYKPEAVKNLHNFDTALNAELKQQHLTLSYRSHRVSPNDTTRSKYQYLSAPFVLNFYDPTVYEVQYSLPFTSILPGVAPYISISLLLVLMVTAAFIFYYRSYKLQAQMTQFKESLFGNITHELKTPLSSLQLIIDNANTGAQQTTISAEHISFASYEISRMKLLIDKILSFGRMSKEQLALNKELLPVDTVISDAISIMDIVLQQAGGKINYSPAEKINIVVDKALLVNTIATIIDNAIKYNTGEPVIDIDVKRDNKNAAITITDNGIGIAPAFHKEIFKPFFRVPTGSRHDVKGHGLGLSFAAQAITLHDGSIIVASEEGKGSSFIISIPTL